jgi:hypothetical protein
MAYAIVKMLDEDGNRKVLEVFRGNARIQERAKHKVFESRYDSKIMDGEKIYLEKLNYIHNNPCVKGWNLAKNSRGVSSLKRQQLPNGERGVSCRYSVMKNNVRYWLQRHSPLRETVPGRKKDFERYEQGIMEPLEKITYW